MNKFRNLWRRATQRGPHEQWFQAHDWLIVWNPMFWAGFGIDALLTGLDERKARRNAR